MIAAPRFYAEHLGRPFVAHDEALRAPGLLRGLRLGWLARRGSGVAVIRRERGTLPALFVCALPPARQHVFVLELIRRPVPSIAWRRVLYGVWWRLVETPLLRRGAAGAQTMTSWEAEEYAHHYGLEPARVHHVPWALCETGDTTPPEVRPEGRAVFASGRTACDWPTLFAAARGSDWRLSVACSERDLRAVELLAAGLDQPVDVRCEIPWAEHEAILRDADVYALVLSDRGLSAGHVRLMSAVEQGAAVVASAVPALEGYAVAGETALLVEPNDAIALRNAVATLLERPGLRAELRDGARRRASAWAYDDYFERLRTVITGDLEIDPATDPSG